ncbi:trigger factor [Mesorhizobium sp. 1B3]|uniref:trigger factor n=1 Tax=Mesorhizobium sp. 1B3 TaxID=3243599 RepID=UPI003D97AEFF
MQVTETLNSGLKREIKVTVPASDMEAKLMERLSDAKSKVRINGFRPGKVPVQHLRKMYGKSFMAEVVNEILNNSTREILSDRGEKAAMQPEIKMTEDEKEAEKILAGNADFEFELAYEVIPAIEIKDYTGIKVTRQVYDVPEDEIEDQVKRVAESARSYEPKDGKAAEGDRLTIDFVGKLDGEPFEGGAGTDQFLVLGSKQFIPGFEEQLVGVKAGEEKTITVTFPDDYSAAHLAGKEAAFDVTVKEVAKPGELELNDETAKNLGLESIERLREIVKGQIESQFGALTRQKVKRELLDQLDEGYKFEAPSKLVEAEFNNIWNQVTADLEAAGRTFADEDTTEEEARDEYRRLAERRVRLGLVLAEIGEKAGVQVSDDEMQRALFEMVRRAPAGQQQQLFDFYRNNPAALTNLRAPLFEEKVVDHLLTQISVTDKKVSKEELLAEDEDGTAEKKPAKKTAAKKAEKAEKKAESADEAEAPKKKATPKKKAATKEAE